LLEAYFAKWYLARNPCAHPNSDLLIDWIGYFTPVGGGVHKRQAVYSLKLFYDSSKISGFYTYSKLAFRSIAIMMY